MSCALIGCLVGAVSSGVLSNRLGRKRLLTLAAIVFAISSLGTGLAAHFTAFVSWRILGGCAIGLASGVSPMYIAEISPAHLRGRLVSLNQLAIVVGILLAQVVNWLIARPVPAGATPHEILMSWNGQLGWRWMFAVTALPSLLFLAATFLVPESPRWLAAKGRHKQALNVLERLGGRAYAEQVLKDLADASVTGTNHSFLAELSSPGMAKVLFLGVALAVLQQWCGINVIFNYAQEIFAAAGYQISGILFNIVTTGVVSLAFTLVALGDRRSVWKEISAARRSVGVDDHLYGIGCFLPLARAGHTDAGAGPCGHGLLLLVAGTGSVGGDCGDLSQPHPRRRNVYSSYCAVDCLLRADLYVSSIECGAGHIGCILDLCGDLFGRLAVSLFLLAGNKREIPGRN